eukprot:g3247.t1
MEKFQQFSDPSTGINPFTDPKLARRSGFVSTFANGAIRIIPLLLKFLLVLLLLLLLCLTDIIFGTILHNFTLLLGATISNFLQTILRPFRRILDKSLAGVTLYVLGFFTINTKRRHSPKHRASLKLSNSGTNIIAINSGHISQILYLQYLYSPSTFVVASEVWEEQSSNQPPSSTSKKHGAEKLPKIRNLTLKITGFSGIIGHFYFSKVGIRQQKSGEAKSTLDITQSNLLDYIRKERVHPVVIALENVRTNGEALIEFLPFLGEKQMSTQTQNKRGSTAILPLLFQFPTNPRTAKVAPNSPSANFFYHLATLCYNFSNNMVLYVLPRNPALRSMEDLRKEMCRLSQKTSCSLDARHYAKFMDFLHHGKTKKLD